MDGTSLTSPLLGGMTMESPSLGVPSGSQFLAVFQLLPVPRCVQV